MPNGHLCYMQTIQIKDQTKNTFMYLFYDFETQQTIEILGDDEKKFTFLIYASFSKYVVSVWRLPILQLDATIAVFASMYSKIIL